MDYTVQFVAGLLCELTRYCHSQTPRGLPVVEFVLQPPDMHATHGGGTMMLTCKQNHTHKGPIWWVSQWIELP